MSKRMFVSEAYSPRISYAFLCLKKKRTVYSMGCQSGTSTTRWLGMTKSSPKPTVTQVPALF